MVHVHGSEPTVRASQLDRIRNLRGDVRLHRGGHVIESVVVTGDDTKHLRSSDEEESATLEMLIDSHLLQKPLSEEQRDGNAPHTNWEFTVPTLPKESFFPRVIKNPESS